MRLERLEAYNIAKECAQLLKNRFNVDKVYLFGSVTGDGIWHDRSDIDIAVEGLPDANYWQALNAVYELLPGGLELDLLSLEELPAEFKARILSAEDVEVGGDVEMPMELIDRLKNQVKLEFDNLERITQELDSFLEQLSEREPNAIELSGIGGHLHSFYMGIERIFERVAVSLNGGLPAGEDWHTLLLREMESEIPDVRPALIDHELALQLLEYLRFRYLFRHTYGYELRWEKCRPLAENVSDILTIFKEQISRFFENLREM